MTASHKGMTVSERFHAIMDFKDFDRLPLLEWAIWWDRTLERWYGEGLPATLTDRYDLYRYFGLDVYAQDWIRAVHWDAPKPASHGAGLIETMDDYEKLRPHLYQILDTWPVDPDQWRLFEGWRNKGEAVSWFTIDGFFWFPRELMGIQNHLLAFYDEPELMHRINEENADFMIKIIDRICQFGQPDFMTFAEDMSYNNGPMISRELFDEFMAPYYRRVIPHLRERGIRVFIDSDGDITTPASWFEDVGIEGILPLERQAGVDLAILREAHPRQAYIGGFDKMTMTKGEEAMRQEFDRLLPVARKGGYLISVDHQTPPGVSLEEYQVFLKLFKEYVVRAAS